MGWLLAARDLTSASFLTNATKEEVWRVAVIFFVGCHVLRF
jgi:hypothetical protein